MAKTKSSNSGKQQKNRCSSRYKKKNETIVGEHRRSTP